MAQVNNPDGCGTCKAPASENARCVTCGAHHRLDDSVGRGRCEQFGVLGVDCKGGSLGLCVSCQDDPPNEKSAPKQEATHLPGCPNYAFVVEQVHKRPAVLLPTGMQQPSPCGAYVLTVGLYQSETKTSSMLLIGHVLLAPSSEPDFFRGIGEGAVVICGVFPNGTWQQPNSDRFLLVIPVKVAKSEC
jgi:hypothetical protein